MQRSAVASSIRTPEKKAAGSLRSKNSRAFVRLLII
jgi:hypothetical protein